MTEPLHHKIIILFGIITERGNGLLVKASKSRLKPVKAGGLDNTNKRRLFANPEYNVILYILTVLTSYFTNIYFCQYFRTII